MLRGQPATEQCIVVNNVGFLNNADVDGTALPPKGAPNVLLIITDDAGFGVPSTFGGVIPTPALDRLAQNGLRYTQMHSTALCSPTRAALITGRNHHSAGFGVVTEISTGYPGYNSIITRDKATIGRILHPNETVMVEIVMQREVDATVFRLTHDLNPSPIDPAPSGRPTRSITFSSPTPTASGASVRAKSRHCSLGMVHGPRT